MFAYKTIYENLATAGLPMLQGTQGKRKYGKAEAVKHGIMITCGVFFFAFTKLGMFNKIFFCLVTSQSLVFMHKCNFYQGIVDDLAISMTLIGQEARIQVRYHLPEHPQSELYGQLCGEYKNLSAAQLDKHRKQLDAYQKAKERDAKLDRDFADRLAAMEGDEEDSITQELPKNRK